MESIDCDLCGVATLHNHRGECTLCLRRESNRSQSIVWLGLGIPLLVFAVVNFSMPDFTFNNQIIRVIARFVVDVALTLGGLALCGRGVLMYLRGAPPPHGGGGL